MGPPKVGLITALGFDEWTQIETGNSVGGPENVARTIKNLSLIRNKMNSLKIDTNFVITVGTRDCLNDNLRCNQWWQSWHHVDFGCQCFHDSKTELLKNKETYYHGIHPISYNILSNHIFGVSDQFGIKYRLPKWPGNCMLISYWSSLFCFVNLPALYIMLSQQK